MGNNQEADGIEKRVDTPPYQASTARILGRNLGIPAVVYFFDVRLGEEMNLWKSTAQQDDYLDRFKKQVLAGRKDIAAVIAMFTNLTDIFQLQPGSEHLFRSGGQYKLENGAFKPNEIIAEDGTIEIGCLIEAEMLGQEAKIWGRSATIGEYLEPMGRRFLSCKLEYPNKLRDCREISVNYGFNIGALRTL